MAHQKRWAGDILSSAGKPIISIKEARKLIGHDSVNLSDIEVMGIVCSLYKIASRLLDNSRVPNNQMVQ